MDPVLLRAIPFHANADALLRQAHVRPETEDAERMRELIAEAEAIARPKGMYKISYVEERSEDAVVVDGIKLSSRVLSVNLGDARRIFPFVATCGRELDAWASGIDDLLESFWAGTIMEAALAVAYDAVAKHLHEHLQPGSTATMNPGSLPDWPMSEQAQLFALLGDPLQAVGVELTDSFLMRPIKSVSGLHFPTESHFENCQLCPREHCPGRRAPYDKDLFARQYLA